MIIVYLAEFRLIHPNFFKESSYIWIRVTSATYSHETINAVRRCEKNNFDFLDKMTF